MKLFITHIILFFALISGNVVHGVNYNDTISSGSPREANTENNIKQSELIEKYIINYKSKIKSLEEKYEIIDSPIIQENTNELDLMIKGLMSIQTNLVEKEDASEVIKSVVEGLKIVNNNLKPYLKIKQREYENRVAALRTKYTPVTKNVSGRIDTLIKTIAAPMKTRNRLSSTQKKILKHLIVLEEESKKLSNFGNRNFETIPEVQSYLRDIILSVRKELQGIKSLI